MARQGQRHFLGRNAAAVVADGDALDAALVELDRDLGSAGIECVFQQFLDHGSRALDDFTGGDLGNELVGKWLDGASRRLYLCIHTAIIAFYRHQVCARSSVERLPSLVCSASGSV